jgi:hypothetical protein
MNFHRRRPDANYARQQTCYPATLKLINKLLVDIFSLLRTVFPTFVRHNGEFWPLGVNLNPRDEHLTLTLVVNLNPRGEL